MRLVLDEHLSVVVAAELRRRGHDVVAVTEDPALVGLEDSDLFAWAARAGRVVVTRDVRGLGALAEGHQIAGEPFAGVIFLSSKRYPHGGRSNGLLVRDLAKLLERYPQRDALSGRTVWLRGD